MFVTSPLTAADNALAASKVQPEGVTAVSGSDESLFQRLASIAAGFTNRTAAVAADLLKPAAMVVPGGSAAQTSVAKVADASAAVAKSAASAVTAAGSGIKTGFTLGIAAVVVILFLFLRHNLK